MNTTIRDLDQTLYHELEVRAALAGKTIGQLVNEAIQLYLARRGLTVASEVTTKLLQAREVEFIPCSELFVEALEVFRGQAAERLSFTNAAIVTVTRRQTPLLVATFDSDFRGLEGISVIPD